jgi:hypothetical protein
MSDTKPVQTMITAEGMMAYVRVQMQMRDETDAHTDKLEHEKTFKWHVGLIITGVILAGVCAYFGLDIYLSIIVGGLPQVSQEAIDIMKGIG